MCGKHESEYLMAEILRYRYNTEFLTALCEKIKNEHIEFDHSAFLSAVFDEEWESKELKERMGHIATCLYTFLPQAYDEAIKILKPVSSHFGGFEPMIFPDYVQRYGQNNYTLSIEALEHFTQFSSSEFAVRPFIVSHPQKMMEQMTCWADSKNYHVRRLASEGCRPRLPWAMALPAFKTDPTPIFPILEKLKNDESEYVRRSVANNLNDIAKDNPDLVIAIATDWLGVTEDTNKLVKHACRTLLKKGNPQIMALFGYAPPNDMSLTDFELNEIVEMGGRVEFSCRLAKEVSNNPLSHSPDKIRIEFAIGFMKSNGKLSRKVFKISEGVLGGKKKADNVKVISKKFSFAPISTRKYYPGEHELAIIINGVEMAKKTFLLEASK